MSIESEVDLTDLPKIKQQLLQEIHRVVVGQSRVIDEMLISLFGGGHCLFIGVPGLAKTLLVNTVSKTMGLDFGRVQFTPDLLPADITGADVLEEDKQTGTRSLRFVKGPVFCNMLLADEINRTPPKTQAALLQAMQEKEVSAGGKTYHIDPPFSVFATQNPIEQEGTYPLPEAQLDRFLLNPVIRYLSLEDEIKMVGETTGLDRPEPEPVLSGEDILSLQSLTRQLPAPETVVSYAVRLTAASRPEVDSCDEWTRKRVRWGAGSRAAQALILAAKARA